MIIKAPHSIQTITFPSVFLAGSIEMGKAEDWQTRVGKQFDAKGFTVLNPRRDDWDESWEQSMANHKFCEQVDWERQGLSRATYILFYFQPGTMSPISLYELGRHATKKCYRNEIWTADPESALAVVCPKGFWRKGNVDLECFHHRIPQFNSIEEAANHLIQLPGDFE